MSIYPHGNVTVKIYKDQFNDELANLGQNLTLYITARTNTGPSGRAFRTWKNSSTPRGWIVRSKSTELDGHVYYWTVQKGLKCTVCEIEWYRIPKVDGP